MSTRAGEKLCELLNGHKALHGFKGTKSIAVCSKSSRKMFEADAFSMYDSVRLVQIGFISELLTKTGESQMANKSKGTAASMNLVNDGRFAAKTAPAGDAYTKVEASNEQAEVHPSDRIKQLRLEMKRLRDEVKALQESARAKAPEIGARVVINKPKSSAHGKSGQVEYLTRSRAFVRIDEKRDAMGFGFAQLTLAK